MCKYRCRICPSKEMDVSYTLSAYFLDERDMSRSNFLAFGSLIRASNLRFGIDYTSEKCKEICFFARFALPLPCHDTQNINYTNLLCLCNKRIVGTTKMDCSRWVTHRRGTPNRRTSQRTGTRKLRRRVLPLKRQGFPNGALRSRPHLPVTKVLAGI